MHAICPLLFDSSIACLSYAHTVPKQPDKHSSPVPAQLRSTLGPQLTQSAAPTSRPLAPPACTQWLSGNVLCPGSLAEAAAACTAAIYDRTSSYNTTAATAPPLRCASRPGCVWLPGSGSTPPPPPAADATNGTALRSESDPANGNGTASPSALTVSDLPIALLVPHLLAGFYDRPWADGKEQQQAGEHTHTHVDAGRHMTAARTQQYGGSGHS